MCKSILLSLLSLLLLPPALAGQSGLPAANEEGRLVDPSTEHIKTPGCTVGYNEEFTRYALHYRVTYADGKRPYELYVEANSTDPDSLWDQCQAFTEALLVAQIEEAIAARKAELKKLRNDHFFINAKLAKK